MKKKFTYQEFCALGRWFKEVDELDDEGDNDEFHELYMDYKDASGFLFSTIKEIVITLTM